LPLARKKKTSSPLPIIGAESVSSLAAEGITGKSARGAGAGLTETKEAAERAAVEYVSCAAQNAAILLRLADAGRRSSDPATAEAAEKLVDSAVRLRLYAIQAIPRLYLRMIFPGARVNVVAP
jgi:hypothetical protein